MNRKDLETERENNLGQVLYQNSLLGAKPLI